MTNTVLYYKSPSEIWTDALPLGNGRMGAMVYGSVLKEEIQCNEETFWSGYPDPDADNPECALHLQEMQELLFEGKTTEAGELARRYLVCKGRGSGGGHGYKHPYGSFETAGSLFLEFDHSDNVENYERVLDISKGIATVSMNSDIPVMFGVVTTENIEQAIERAGTKAGNKGYDCALGAIEMVNLIREIEA